MLEQMTSIPVENGLSREPGDSRLKKTCAEFESIFLTYMLKSSGGAIAEGGFLGNSHESQMVKSMFDENLAIGIAQNGGIGIGSMLYERLRDSASKNAPGKEVQTDPPVLTFGEQRLKTETTIDNQ